MAQLAHCPACNCEVTLPDRAAAAGAPAEWFECPDCSKVFAVADAKPHKVKQARPVAPPTEPNQDAATGADDASESTSKLSGTTLSSFLGDTARASEAAADTPTLADFKSLDDLIRQAPGESSPADPPVEPSEAVERNDADIDEPFPAADRLRPTLEESLGSESEAGGPGDNSGSYDTVEAIGDDPGSAEDEAMEPETADFAARPGDFAVPSSLESTLRDQGDLVDTEVASSLRDAPSFDFEVGESADEHEAKSLRASMGFTDDDPLEIEDPVEKPNFDSIDTHEVQDVAPELNVDVGDAPRGKIAARKRSTAMSLVRTFIGVVGGGVVGIVAGYLVLLWIFHFLGRADEPLALAMYYPNVVKPSTFQDTATTPPAVPVDHSGIADDEPPTDDGTLEPIGDGGVEVASFETDVLPTDEGPEPWEFAAQPAPRAVITGAPNYTAAELQQLTSVAEEVAPDLVAPGPIDKAKGSSYARIAKLAEALTFGEGAADVSWKNNAREVFPPLFANDERSKQVSTIAEFWLVSPKRGHGGIFFCGKPDAGRQQGSVAEYTFTLPTDSRQQLTVLVPRAMAESTVEAPSVVVVGAVIDDPATRIEGYTGTAAQAVWSADVFPVTE